MKEGKRPENSKWFVISKIIDVIIYVSIIGILVFWQIFPEVFPNLSIETILISILVLFGVSWLHVIENIESVKKLFKKLDTADVMQYGYLNTLLGEIIAQKHKIADLKISDISAEDFLFLFSQEKVTVNNCTLILREYDVESDEYDQKKVDQIETSIAKWKKLQKDGRIKNLKICKCSTNQTSFFCIIDGNIVLSGFLKDESIREDPNVLLVDITSKKGYQLIQQYVNEFDYLFALAINSKRTNSVAGNVFAYTNVSKDKSKEKLRRELHNTKKLSVVGLACTEISNLSYEELYDILVKNDGHLQIMYMNPDTQAIRIRERIEHGDDISEFQFPGIVKYNMNRLITNVNAIKKTNNLPDDWNHVEIGTYDFQPSINCIITDNYVFVHHYGIKHCGMDVPNYIISRATDPEIYDYYVNYVNECYWGEK